MTVKELIEKLQAMQQDSVVSSWYAGSEDGPTELSEVGNGDDAEFRRSKSNLPDRGTVYIFY